ncbi:MAG: metallophosphoesterase family protein [Cyanobacteriota bacterium]|nr:metallophosphoesterase family protein [Cyanobacteriota bacterium]
MTFDPRLLTDPFLQLPTENSVRVAWFTEFPGTQHQVYYGKNFQESVSATTQKLTRAREDSKSRVGEQTEDGQRYEAPAPRDIWRHEAVVGGLVPNQRIPYRVSSFTERGEEIRSREFTLAPKPKPGTSLNILLTSDHQLMPMTAANLQKVAETVESVDAIFLAGDLINIPDRASEWFDDNRGGAFFPCLQGLANYTLKKGGTTVTYTGGELIQHAPLYAAIGNHEVMGRYSARRGLNKQFGDAVPRATAATDYDLIASQINPRNDSNVRDAWIKSNSFNTDTYEEILTLPQSIPGGEKYYAVTFGDIRLVTLFITNIWRSPDLKDTATGRYREAVRNYNKPENWGRGQHIFEPIAKGSPQYQWLEQELNSPEFQQAKYKIVMFHHPPHSLGDNIVPPYTDPVPLVQYAPDEKVKSVRYEYPIKDDYLIRDIEPLLNEAGVQLVYFGHSHLWNRFQNSRGIHFLESSNVGNSYGAYIGEKKRPVPAGFKETYAAVGDPNGLTPIVPTLKPLKDEQERPLPYLSSNDITVFSILETRAGTVSSYRFDTRDPDSQVIKFDEFKLTD